MWILDSFGNLIKGHRELRNDRRGSVGKKIPIYRTRSRNYLRPWHLLGNIKSYNFFIASEVPLAVLHENRTIPTHYRTQQLVKLSIHRINFMSIFLHTTHTILHGVLGDCTFNGSFAMESMGCYHSIAYWHGCSLVIDNRYLLMYGWGEFLPA